jgi:hypothetical protein
LVLLSASAVAQTAPLTPPSPDRLPADTWVLVTWHGAGAANKVRATNPVTRLWDDPKFVSTREQLIKRLLEEVASERKEGDEPLTREDVDDILSLLENPGVLGVTGDPFAKATGGQENVHVFFAYNKTGKGDIVARLKKKEKPKPNSEVSSYTFRGVEIKKTVTTTPVETPKPAPKGPEEAEPAEREQEPKPPQPKISYGFEASLGDYELMSDNQEVMETLITRLQGKPGAAESLLQNAVYRSAQRFRADGAMLEMFLKMPDFNQLPLPPTPQMDTQAFARELHLERLHGLWLSMGLAPDRALVRTALLGDMSPGSILDIIGNNVSEFQTLAASPLSGPYGAFRLDLPALYATLLRAAKAGLPPEQAAAADMMDGMVAMQTGMPLTDLLNLFTGEIGTVSTGEEQMAEFLPDVIMIPVTKSEPVLNLLRTLAGTFIRGEEAVSGATVLTMAPPPPASEAGAKPVESKPFYVAVSPAMLVVSPGMPQMSDILARSAAGNSAPAGSLAGDAKFLAVRKMLPAQLNGISYADWTRLPWDKQLKLMEKQLAKQRQETLERADAAEKGDENNPPDPKRAEALRKSVKTMEEIHQALIELMPLVQKYFKVSAGGTWKAPDGLFIYSFIH